MLQAHPKSGKIRQAFLITGVILGWFALIAQFYLIIVNRTASVPETIVRYFSFFTILSNIMVALCFTLPLISPRSQWGKFFSKSTTLAAVALYIAATCAIYNTVLRPLSDLHGLQLIVDELLHLIIPILFIVYWVFFVPKASLTWKDTWSWMIYPAVYSIYTLLRGAIVGYYPYPFFNAGRFGYKKVFINYAGLILLFFALALLLVAAARLINRQNKNETV